MFSFVLILPFSGMSGDNLPNVFSFNINACNSSEFGCSNGICIPRFERCNMRSECSDGEDETNCNSIVTPPGNVSSGQISHETYPHIILVVKNIIKWL